MSMLSPALEQKVRELKIRADGLPDDADYRVKNTLVLDIYGAVGEYLGQEPKEGSRLASLLTKKESSAKNRAENEAARNLLKHLFLRNSIAHPRSDSQHFDLRVQQVRSLADSLWALVFSVHPRTNAHANAIQTDEPSAIHDYARAFKQQWGWKSKDTWVVAASAHYDLQMNSDSFPFDAVLSELGNMLLVRLEDRVIWLDPLTLKEQFELSFEGDKILDFAVEINASHCAVLVGPALYLMNKEGETIWCRDAATGSEEVHDFPFDEDTGGGAVYLANGKIIASLNGDETVTNVFSLSGKILTRLEPSYALRSVTRDGKWLMFRYLGVVELMDSRRRQPVWRSTQESHEETTEISADGSVLASIDIGDWDSGATEQPTVLRFRRPSGKLISEKVLANDDTFLNDISGWYIDPLVLTQDGAYCLIHAGRARAQESLIGLFDSATAEPLWLNDAGPGLGGALPPSSSGFYRSQFNGGMKITPDARLIAVTKPDGFILYNGEGGVLQEVGNQGGRTSIVGITPGGHGIITATYLEEQRRIVLARWSRV